MKVYWSLPQMFVSGFPTNPRQSYNVIYMRIKNVYDKYKLILVGLEIVRVTFTLWVGTLLLVTSAEQRLGSGSSPVTLVASMFLSGHDYSWVFIIAAVLQWTVQPVLTDKGWCEGTEAQSKMALKGQLQRFSFQNWCLVFVSRASYEPKARNP